LLQFTKLNIGDKLDLLTHGQHGQTPHTHTRIRTPSPSPPHSNQPAFVSHTLCKSSYL